MTPAPPPLPVIDDATRSVSVRLPVTDCGRLRVLAHKLRVRESTAIRLAITLALAELDALISGSENHAAVEAALARLAAGAAREGLSPERTAAAVNRTLPAGHPAFSAEGIASAWQRPPAETGSEE